jgi:hypothetical protein
MPLEVQRKKVMPIIGMVLFVCLALLIPAVAQGSNIVSIPDNLVVAPGNSTSTAIILENSTGVASIGMKLSYDPSVVQVIGATKGDFASFFGFDNTSAANGGITINTLISGQDLIGDVKVADVLLEAVGNPGDSSPLNLEIISMADQYGTDVSGITKSGLFTVTPLIFDTGSPANLYPSISGRHNGTIAPNADITVTRLYTYPCPGTGGHTKSIELYENDGLIASGQWEGYYGDWHNITITPSVTLQAWHIYNFTIVTGSYPQIIYEHEFNATGGTITCSSFEDANGNVLTDGIPAIRLF